MKQGRRGQIVVSDEGFEVEVQMERSDIDIKYTTGARTLYLAAYYRELHGPLLVAAPRNLRWEDDRQNRMEQSERDQIIDRVKRALEFSGENIEFVMER